MKKHASPAPPRRGVQLTVRNVPGHVAKTLRGRAQRERKSINRVLVEALSRQAGEAEPRFDDLDWIAGTWEPDPAFDEAIALQDQVDEALWR